MLEGGGGGDGPGDGGGEANDPVWFAYDMDVSDVEPQAEGSGVTISEDRLQVTLDASTPSGWTFTLTSTGAFQTGFFNTRTADTAAANGGFTLTIASASRGSCTLDVEGDALAVVGDVGSWDVRFATDAVLIGAGQP